MTKHFFVRTLISTTITALLTTLPSQAHALNILLTNDDGVTANVKALKTALDNAGHDVLIAVPCSNQSGKGASINFLSPITPLTTACRGGAAAAGAAGIGPVDAVTGLSNAYYANGTPIMALLYGLDVLAPQRWGKAPDLVISGPNEGQNVGGIVISSGTVSNAQFAIHRGLPAIAVSADTNTTDNPTLAAEAAALTVQLLDKLEQRSGHRGILPKGYALNVNYPKFDIGGSAALPWEMTRFGNFDSYDVHFVSKLADDTTAQHVLPAQYLNYPGVSITSKTAADATAGTDPKSEALEILNGKITVTPMQFGYEVSPVESKLFGLYLQKCLAKHEQH